MEPKVNQMEAQLKVWGVKIHEYVADAQKSRAWARIDLRQRIDDLKIKHALCRSKLDTFVAAGSDRRDELRSELEHVWKELEDVFKEMKI